MDYFLLEEKNRKQKENFVVMIYERPIPVGRMVVN
jgi:hypothetical protein